MPELMVQHAINTMFLKCGIKPENIAPECSADGRRPRRACA